jgi:hypothetical protein
MSLDDKTIKALDGLRKRLDKTGKISRSETVRLFAQAYENAPLELSAILKQLTARSATG